MHEAAPLRVLHLCAGNLYGGVERIVAECAISRALCPEMAPSFAVCFDGRLAQEIDERRGALHAGSAPPGPAVRTRSCGAPARLARVLEARDRPAAVICHSSWVFGLAAPVVRAAGAALVLWVHDRLSGRTWPERWARPDRAGPRRRNSAFTAGERAVGVSGSGPDGALRARVSRARDVPRAPNCGPVRRSLGADERTAGHPDGEPVRGVEGAPRAPRGGRADCRTMAPVDCRPAAARRRRGVRTVAAGFRRSLRHGSDRVTFLGERRDVPALMRAADIHLPAEYGARAVRPRVRRGAPCRAARRDDGHGRRPRDRDAVVRRARAAR